MFAGGALDKLKEWVLLGGCAQYAETLETVSLSPCHCSAPSVLVLYSLQFPDSRTVCNANKAKSLYGTVVRFKEVLELLWCDLLRTTVHLLVNPQVCFFLKTHLAHLPSYLHPQSFCLRASFRVLFPSPPSGILRTFLRTLADLGVQRSGRRDICPHDPQHCPLCSA